MEENYGSLFTSDISFTGQFISMMFGFMISEVYYSKFTEKRGIILLWVLFASSVTLISFQSIDDSVLFILISYAGLVLFCICSGLLLIVEIGFLTPYVKSNPNTYAISLLLSLNQIPEASYYLLDRIKNQWSLLVFLGALTICVMLTCRLKGKPTRYTVEKSSRYIELPFSAFAVEYYVSGV